MRKSDEEGAMPPHLMEEPPLLDSRSVKTPLGTSFIKTGLLILSLILSLGILELAIRLSGYDLNRDPNWRFDHQLGWVVDSEAAAIDSVQPNGFRHSPAGMRKPPRMRRVLILGDSFALATGVPYGRSFPGL